MIYLGLLFHVVLDLGALLVLDLLVVVLVYGLLLARALSVSMAMVGLGSDVQRYRLRPGMLLRPRNPWWLLCLTNYVLAEQLGMFVKLLTTSNDVPAMMSACPK